jgi:methionine biosynthesis protein MetW
MSHKYNFEIDVSNRKSVYSQVVRAVRPGSRVLDVGCDTGHLGAYLKGTGCSVDGIEMDEAAASEAETRLDAVYRGSIDEDLTGSLVPGYDYIILADVLEHLPYPDRTLDKLKPLLNDGGQVIASIPNVANFRVRFRLLFGIFEYTEIGILDRTHLRFYTFKTARKLFTDAGFKVLDQRPAATHLPMALIRLLPGMFATRCVIKAKPADRL